MARYKSWSANPVGDYSKRLAKKRSKNSVFGSKKRKKSGCYVATCVYGSYDCPEVWVLRRFRDNKLENSVLGRTFITVYYTVSPLLVKCFGNTAFFKKGCKNVLNSLISKLRSKGYEDTPYNDLY